MIIEWSDLMIEVEAEWEPDTYCATDRGTQKIPGYWQVTKVGFMGIDITEGIKEHDVKYNTDFMGDIEYLYNNGKN